jgi:hypothetical protein
VPQPDRADRDPVAAQELLQARLQTVVRRLRITHLLNAVAAGSLAASASMLTLMTLVQMSRRAALPIASVAAVAVAAGVVLWRRNLWTAAEAARVLERVHPDSRNVIVTAEELHRHSHRASHWIKARVVVDAAAALGPIAVSRAVPLHRAALASVVAIGAWAAVAAGLPQRTGSMIRETVTRLAEATGSAKAPGITATIVAPAYLGGGSRTARNPDRLEAVAGSRLSLVVAGEGSAWRVRMGAKPIATGAAPNGVSADIVLTESSYLVVEEASTAENAAGRKLIPVIVTPDRIPSIRIELPAKDLLLPDGKPDIPIATSATDDFGLSSLELRFTKVSGSGEQFDFQEGTIPLALERENPRAWKGRAALPLSKLKLEPGDSLVYRVVGSDARGGEAGMASSDTFFVEIEGPGQVTIAGFELPPDRERYALSQQMIVLKIQRLRAREKTIAREAVEREMADIAAEQRAVRANFVFLTGGHVEDEEEEAAHSHEIQEGRLENSARREIGRAIQYMSKAEEALVAIDSGGALPPAKAAVDALQRAFGRNRYILRTTPVRSRIDPARRLSGELDAAVDSTRAAYEATDDAVTRAARDLLAGFLDLSAALASDPARVDTNRVSAMAEQSLAAGAAGSKEWQQVSALFLELREAVARHRARADIESLVNRTVAAVLVEVRKGAIPAVPTDEGNRALLGAWSAEKRNK